jgi:hypothetical protein
VEGQAPFRERHQPLRHRTGIFRLNGEGPDLEFAATYVDLVSLSFVRRPEDVVELIEELDRRLLKWKPLDEKSRTETAW